MPDETTAVIETPPSESGPVSIDPQFDRVAAEEAADKFLNATRAELANETPPPAPDRKRGPDGKFLKKEEQIVPPPQGETTPSVAQAAGSPAVDPVWKELAKEEGISDETIATLKSEAEIEAAIQTQRVGKFQQAAQLLGMTPQVYAEFVQWKQGQGAAPQGQQPSQQTQTPPATTVPVELPKVEYDEDEFTPKQIETLKALEARANKAEMTAAETQKLSQKLAELENAVRQSAMQAQVAQQQAMFAESWDKAAARIPGFTEYFGKPSDLLRLGQTQPNHQRVRDYIGFDAHFQPIWQSYVARVGENDTALYLAIRDAWNASPYSKLGGRNGNNGSAQANGNGSVVRNPPRRSQPQESMPVNGDIQGEMDRVLAGISEVWDSKGENPFKDLGI